MGYMIQYSPEDNGKYPNKATIQGKRIFLRIVKLMIISVLLFATIHYRHKLVQWLLPGDGETTLIALESFSERLRDGESVKDAVTAFCSEILSDASS